MVPRHEAYWEAVDLKYQIYNGLFLSLPFYQLRRAGILLPVFAERAASLLEQGASPSEVVESFFTEQLGDAADETTRTDLIFRFLQLVERQVVLFDALEDAAFERVHDLEGPGTLHDVLTRIVTADRRGRYADVLDEFRVRVVLTAHPTQFYPNSILGIITDLAEALAANDTTAVYDLLLQLGKTRSRNRNKPTPRDEAESLIWFLENIFYEATADVHESLVAAADKDRRSALLRPGIIELGFWPGGDRDGNPFVDAETTLDVARMLRHAILERYLADVDMLSRRLTFDGAIDRVSAIRDRLAATRWGTSSDTPYPSANELLADLMHLRDHIADRHDGLFVDGIGRLIVRVQLFGLHFATLDLRQDSRIHRAAVERLLPGYGDLDRDARVGRLEQLLETASPAAGCNPIEVLGDNPVLADTVLSIGAARKIRAQGGPRALHRYIISNTRDEANVLEVLLLIRLAYYDQTANDDRFVAEDALDIVPLFETVDDLGQAPIVMDRLYRSPVYRAYLERRGNRQTIMLGFSDGTKDGGYVSANWLIYRAKERLTEVSVAHNVRVVFFEGRGGPPARGGGKTHQFFRAMSRRMSREQIQLTIQGQTISSNYGTVPAARFNLEQLVSAGLENILLPSENPDLDEAQSDLVEELSQRSLAAYRALKLHPDFVSYLETMTPLVYYGQANNASRPTSRSSGGPMRFEDLRAIPFVGAWSQMKQNVPGYYGFGTALAALVDDGRLAELQQLFHDNLFFRTLVENSMQSLSKVNFEITRYIGDDQRYGDLWRMLHDEYTRSVDTLKRVAGSPTLTPGDQGLLRSISLREKMVLPVLAIQQYALESLRRGAASAADTPDHRKLLEQIVVKSMAAIVNAARNSV